MLHTHRWSHFAWSRSLYSAPRLGLHLLSVRYFRVAWHMTDTLAFQYIIIRYAYYLLGNRNNSTANVLPYYTKKKHTIIVLIFEIHGGLSHKYILKRLHVFWYKKINVWDENVTSCNEMWRKCHVFKTRNNKLKGKCIIMCEQCVLCA